MRSSTLAIVTILAGLLVLPGCWFLAGAAVAAGTLVVTGEDSVEATLEKPFDPVYEAAVAELERRGTIRVRTREFGRLEGDVVVPNDASVVVKVERLGDRTTKLTVSARKLAKTIPDRDVAQAIGTSIIQAVAASK
jgi:hypothetical protein